MSKLYAEYKDFVSTVKDLNKRKNGEQEAINEKYKSFLCKNNIKKEELDKLNAEFSNELREKLADYMKEMNEHSNKMEERRSSKILATEVENELNNELDKIKEKHKDILSAYKKARADFCQLIEIFCDNAEENSLATANPL